MSANLRPVSKTLRVVVTTVASTLAISIWSGPAHAATFGLAGEYPHATWQDTFYAQGVRTARLSVALAMIVPPEVMAKTKIEASPSDLARVVQLRDGVSRQIALQRIAEDLGRSFILTTDRLAVVEPEPVAVPPPVASVIVAVEAPPPPVVDSLPPQAFDAPAPPPLYEFAAEATDNNIRQTISRWAEREKWAFSADHWTVNYDIPLSGTAGFGQDFREAVQALLSGTELTATPLQPCFYSNRVVRVIPLLARCDQTKPN